MVGGDGQKVCKRTDAVGSAEERERVGFANRTYGFDVLFAAVMPITIDSTAAPLLLGTA